MRSLLSICKFLLLPPILIACSAGSPNSTNLPPPDLAVDLRGADLAAGDGGCMPGSAEYKLETGTYRAGTVSGTSDGCSKPPLTDQDISMVDFSLMSDGMGNITFSNIQKGPVRCNQGILSSDVYLSDGSCTYRAQTTVSVVVTADNNFIMKYDTLRSTFTQTAGGATCMPPASGSCTITYRAQLGKR